MFKRLLTIVEAETAKAIEYCAQVLKRHLVYPFK